MPERLPPNQQLIEAPRWPVVGEKKPAAAVAGLTEAAWPFAVAGEVERPRHYTLHQLQQFPHETRTIDVHCVTRWSRYDMTFTGVSLARILELANPTPQARFLSFVAHSDRDHSTSLPLAEAVELQAMLVWAANHAPLESIHGGPLRMVVPGKYFYKSVKWLKRIDVLREDRLGYWEAETGYHNGADPWREERFLAPSLDKRAAAKLLAARDFAGQDLRSLSAADRNLDQLSAEKALLRNADFQRSSLVKANFHAANLSNARLRFADLRHADFCDADLEGADFTGADLRGADLRRASLFGASFCEPGPTNGARFDAQTLVQREQLEALTDLQRDYLRHELPRFAEP